MKKFKAVYPGSFDPITNGHLDILDRTLSVFSEVVILVAGTSLKSPIFTPEERVSIIRDVVGDRKGVSVELWPGLTVEYARQHGISAVIRGLRAASDFEHEFMMASMNRELNAEVETLFMMTSKNLFFVSSSMIKDLFRFGGDISPYVPHQVVEKLQKRYPSR